VFIKRLNTNKVLAVKNFTMIVITFKVTEQLSESGLVQLP